MIRLIVINVEVSVRCVMVLFEKDDCRLLNDVDYLKNKAINPTEGEEIMQYAKRILEENIEPVYEKEVVISLILVIMKLEKAIAIGVVDLD